MSNPVFFLFFFFSKKKKKNITSLSTAKLTKTVIKVKKHFANQLRFFFFFMQIEGYKFDMISAFIKFGLFISLSTCYQTVNH